MYHVRPNGEGCRSSLTGSHQPAYPGGFDHFGSSGSVTSGSFAFPSSPYGFGYPGYAVYSSPSIGPAHSHGIPTPPADLWTLSRVRLNQKLRSLWEQHVYWTRLTVNSIIARQPDEAATTARLLRNASDFAEAFAPYYGQAIANRLGELLKSHLTIAAELVTALRDGKSAAAEDARKRWFQNADQIAEFLGRINPYWSREEWRRMLYEHLRLLSQEIATRLAGNYEENVATSTRVEAQALEMADMMTDGIVRQFPSAFAR